MRARSPASAAEMDTGHWIVEERQDETIAALARFLQ